MFELVVRFNSTIVQIGDVLDINIEGDANEENDGQSKWLVKAISEDPESITVDWTNSEGEVLYDQVIQLDWWPAGAVKVLKIDTKDLAKDPNLAFKLRRKNDDQ
jgi:hypothetical protein